MYFPIIRGCRQQRILTSRTVRTDGGTPETRENNSSFLTAQEEEEEVGGERMGKEQKELERKGERRGRRRQEAEEHRCNRFLGVYISCGGSA